MSRMGHWSVLRFPALHSVAELWSDNVSSRRASNIIHQFHPLPTEAWFKSRARADLQDFHELVADMSDVAFRQLKARWQIYSIRR